MPIRATRRRGLTLIELVVVLLIMTVLATVAVNMLEPQVEQARFEAAQKTMESLRQAVLGRPEERAADGTPLVSGFLADVGRPPLVLEELWLNGDGVNQNLPAFGHHAPAGDPEVTVAAGWNGPYLQLPLGGTALADGWGQPFDLHRHDGAPSTAADPIHLIRSRGRDGLLDGLTPPANPYERDVVLPFWADSAAVAAGLAPREVNILSESLAVHVYYGTVNENPDSGNGAHVVVRVYGPVNGGAGTVASQSFDLAASPDAPVVLTFSELPLGPKVVRAYQVGSLPANDDDPIVATVRSTARRMVVSRHTTSLELILH